MKTLWQNIEQYLLLSISLSFLGGILLYHYFSLSENISTALAILIFIPVFFFTKKSQSPWTIIFLLLLAFALGFLHMAHHESNRAQEKTIYSRITQETDVVLSGTLHSMPLFDGEKTTLLIKSRYFREKQHSDFSKITGLVLVKLRERLQGSYKPGDELIIRCQLARPYRFGNPGGFDYPAFLAAKDISIVGRSKSVAHFHPLQSEKTLLSRLQYLPEQIRCDIRDFLDKHLDTESAAIYRALLIGDRSGIGKNRFETFKASGVVHIFAISGIHLSLVASALFLVFYWLLRRSSYLLLRFSCKKLALLSTIPFLTAYALLAGAQTPVLRSLIMVIVFIVAFCVQRQRSPFTTLSFAALLILIHNPLSLFTVSFQLSFIAVASLILIFPKLKKIFQTADAQSKLLVPYYKKAMTWTIVAILISIIATLGTAPLLLYYFNRISTVGPLANLLLEPLLCLWSLPVGLFAIPLIYITPSIAEFIFSFGNIGITASLYLSDFFSELPFSSIWLATPSIGVILFYYFTILFCFSKNAYKRLPLFLLACTLFFFPPRTILHYFSNDSELIFLDVGQGSATLLILPHGKTILVDGGGASSNTFNVGESVIAPYLWYRGLTRLDTIIITHPDADHYNGIPFLLKRFKPDNLLVNGENGHDQHYIDLLNIAKSLHIKISNSEKRQIVFDDKRVILQNINNPFQNEMGASSNDKSIILHFSHGDFSCILAGDISKRVEHELLQNGTALEANILLSPHHGSKTSNSYPFLKKVNPQQIIVSAGRFHPEHFPSAQLRKYCDTHSIPLLNTATHGAIKVHISNKQSTLTSFIP